MKLTEFVRTDAILPSLVGVERDDVIRELVGALGVAGAIDPARVDEIVSAVLVRESRGSTGFGKGVAVPHVKHAAIPKMFAAIGLSKTGVEFASLDRQPVYSVFLLLSPEDSPEEHLLAMEAIFSQLNKDTFRRFLRQAGTVADVVDLLREVDHEQSGG